MQQYNVNSSLWKNTGPKDVFEMPAGYVLKSFH